MRHRSAALLASLALAAACGDRPTPTDPPQPGISSRVVTNERIPIFFGVLNPCNGEELTALEGDVHIVISMTDDRAGGFHFTAFNGGHFTGIGAVTGSKYTGFYNSNTHFEARGPFPQVVTSASPGTMVISSGSGPNFLSFILIHFTVDANGRLTAQRSELRTECRG